MPRRSYQTDRIPAFLHPFVILTKDANREKMNPDFINRVVELINVERTQADLDSLQIDSQLSQAAQLHTESMATDDFFSHYGVDGSSPFERIQDTGYQYSTAALQYCCWISNSRSSCTSMDG